MADEKNGTEAEVMVSSANGAGLFERNKPLPVLDAGTGSETLKGLNSKDECSGTNKNEKKTYGRTPDGSGMF